MTIEQCLDLEREDRRHESIQAQLSGRRKFTCCHQCGGVDGMQAVHRETLIQLKVVTVVSKLAPWYSEPGNVEYLFCSCPHCNPVGRIPDGYEQILFIDILDWLQRDRDPMVPDYEALAAEPVAATAGQDSWDSAGLER